MTSLFEEALAFDNDSCDASRCEQAVCIRYGHSKDESPSFDRFKNRVGIDGLAGNGWRQMIELNAMSNARCSDFKVPVNGSDRGFFCKRNEARSCQHRDITGFPRRGKVGFAHREGTACAESCFERHAGTVGEIWGWILNVKFAE